MKFAASLLLFFAAPSLARAFHVSLLLQPSRHSLRSRQRSTSSLFYGNAVEKDEFDLTDVTGQVEAVFNVAQRALDDETQGKEFPATNFTQEIDLALMFAYQVVDELQREQQEYQEMLKKEKENPNALIDVDRILGEEKSREVIELLSNGFMNATGFDEYIQKRKEEIRILREQMAEQAKKAMEQKEEEARLLKVEIRRAEMRRWKRERIVLPISVAIEGTIIGCALGLFAWSALPALGDNISPVVPTVLAGGVLGCASVMASTSGTSVARAMKAARFGFVSRFLFANGIYSVILQTTAMREKQKEGSKKKQGEWDVM